jgi:hypothetical protein
VRQRGDGVFGVPVVRSRWIPAFAGMTMTRH